MTNRAFPYYTVMIDHGGRLGYEAVVQPELTRANIIDRVRSREYDNIVFIQYVTPDDKPEDVTEEILEAAGRLHEDGPVLAAVDLRAMQFDQNHDHRKNWEPV